MRTHRVRPDPSARSAFAGFCFPPDVIVLAIRWYLRFGLSYRDVEELLAERGIDASYETSTTATACMSFTSGLGKVVVSLRS